MALKKIKIKGNTYDAWATSANVDDAKEDIIDALGNIDLSGVAQQGSDPDVSLTSVDGKIDDFYDTFDADIALQLQGIIGDTEESVGGTSQTATQVEELRTLQESYDELSGNMQSLADSWAAMVTNRGSLAGYTFMSRTTIDYAGELLSRRNLIVSIDDPNILEISANYYFYYCTNLQRVSFPNLTTISAGAPFVNCISLNDVYMPALQYINGQAFQQCTSLEYLSLPELKTIASSQNFYNSGNLKVLNIPKLESFSNNSTFSNCVNLIDIVFGSRLTTNINISTWNPTNALSSSSSSLVDTGETFANNLEKLLYNIREHIAANLPDRTGLSALTITFSAAVKAAINGDTATAQAFSNKNWTVA